jgi:hypothetical protein
MTNPKPVSTATQNIKIVVAHFIAVSIIGGRQAEETWRPQFILY